VSETGDNSIFALKLWGMTVGLMRLPHYTGFIHSVVCLCGWARDVTYYKQQCNMHKPLVARASNRKRGRTTI